MNSKDRQKELKGKLDKELVPVVFSEKSKVEVLSLTHPQTLQEKLKGWWNKDVTIPLIPIGAVLVLFITVGSVMAVMENDVEVQRYLIEKGGNLYWSDMLESGGDDQ
ncbi:MULTISPECIES: hypothetical protein [Bacillaceae]|uniref:Uncharacterized protein n=1 Tax=Evansella alkalicola TaxID=745819 RepID=A0ABS6JQS2_9BACI|nr:MULTISPECIES: hypothetical protein [Bacillaceae]MBU9720887.1 hypothetical protein [Bacillus alkalicola]